MNESWIGKLVVAAVAALLAVGAGSVAAASGGVGDFEAADYERERTEGAEDWSWPEAEEFGERWREIEDAAVPRVVVGEIRMLAASDEDEGQESLEVVREYETSLVAVVEKDAKVIVEGIQGPDPQSDWEFHRAFRGLGDLEVHQGVDDIEAGGELIYDHDGGRLVIQAEYVGAEQEIRARDWRDRVYVETLVDWGGSVYEDGPEKADEALSITDLRVGLESDDAQERREAVQGLLASSVDSSSHVWSQALNVLEEGKDDELKRQIYARYRPMGRCSMDTRPQQTAKEYSEVCGRLGDLGCFVPLRLRVINNTFDRVAWSTMGERAHDPASQGLRKAPIDMERFVRGLTLAYAVGSSPRHHVSIPRLGQMVGHEFDETIDELMAMAEDEELDDYNRLTATQVLYFAAMGYGDDDDRLLRRIKEASLTPAAQHFVEQNERYR